MIHPDHLAHAGRHGQPGQLVELEGARRLLRQESEWLDETQRRLRAKRLARLTAPTSAA